MKLKVLLQNFELQATYATNAIVIPQVDQAVNIVHAAAKCFNQYQQANPPFSHV